MAHGIDPRIFSPEFLRLLEGMSIPPTRSPHNPTPGTHLSRRHGASLEFSELRPYEAGDDLRSVDWNAYRRLKRLFVRRFQAERSQDVYILLDTSRSMGLDAEKFAVARRLAAACGFLASKQLDRLTLVPFADALTDRFVQSSRGTIPFELLAYLSRLETGGKTDIGSCAFGVAERIRRGALVVFVTDFFDNAGLEAGLRALALRNADAAFFHVYSGEESQPSPRGPVTFIDQETQEHYEITVDRGTAKAYAEAFGRFIHETREMIEGYGGQYVNAPVDTPIEELMLRFIEPRERLATHTGRRYKA